MKPLRPLHGLVAAVHTPFHSGGSLNLAVVRRQAEGLRGSGVGIAFVGGTTGEGLSLSVGERRELAEAWLEEGRGAGLDVVVHVGANALEDARTLAAHAAERGALAIASVSPSYFKPDDVDALAGWCAAVAAAAPSLPFYFYDIPALTGVRLPMPDFLERAPARIPTLAGLKFTSPDLLSYQLCLHAGGGAFDVPYGVDEWHLAALALGARGAVGSTYNFAAPVYHRLRRAFEAGDLETARAEQLFSARLVRLLSAFGFMAAARAVMAMTGVDVGPPRAPHAPLPPARRAELRAALEDLGFFDRIRG
jgi:N-acetylneuraminate lyase